MCSLLYPNTCQKIDPSSQFLYIFNPTSLKIVPLFILCPKKKKKNLFNLLVYLRAVFLCPSALSPLSRWLWGLVRHKSNPLPTPRHAGVYTSGRRSVSPGKRAAVSFARGRWETDNGPCAAWQSPRFSGLAVEGAQWPSWAFSHTKTSHRCAWGLTHTPMHPLSRPTSSWTGGHGSLLELLPAVTGWSRVTPWQCWRVIYYCCS